MFRLQACNSFRVGKTCCDFICLDDMLPKRPDGSGGPGGGLSSNDFGLRMVASAVTAILSLTLLLFLIHRLRQRKIRGELLLEELLTRNLVKWIILFNCYNK